jgi:hypothetical protein
MLSGVMWTVQSLLALAVSDPDEALWLDALFIIGVLLTLAGLVGLHALQKRNYGRTGRTTFARKLNFRE